MDVQKREDRLLDALSKALAERDALLEAIKLLRIENAVLLSERVQGVETR